MTDHEIVTATLTSHAVPVPPPLHDHLLRKGTPHPLLTNGVRIGTGVDRPIEVVHHTSRRQADVTIADRTNRVRIGKKIEIGIEITHFGSI